MEVASAEVAAGNQSLSVCTERTASGLQQTASAMVQLTAIVQQSADATELANKLAVSASGFASRGGHVVGPVVATMDEISSNSKKIADIIGVINDIAFQTNILATPASWAVDRVAHVAHARRVFFIMQPGKTYPSRPRRSLDASSAWSIRNRMFDRTRA